MCIRDSSIILICLSVLSLAIAPRLMKREAAAKAEMDKTAGA